MLDQSFSPENFNTIFEIENRKGRLDRDYFSEDYDKASKALTIKRKEIKSITDKSNPLYKFLLEEKENIIVQKESILKEDLAQHSKIVNQPSFSFKLKSFLDPFTEKTIYTISKDGPSFFAIKQLQFNFSRSFKVKQANRHELGKQIQCILNDNLPKYIVRTDIEGFYESVPQGKLIKLINENQLLSPKSKSSIINILYQYNSMTNQLDLPINERKGIPRGIGISAYLSELYMRDIDARIKQIDSLTFYGRYVDDIIMVFTPVSEKKEPNYYLGLVEKIVNHEDLNLKRTLRDEYIDNLNDIVTNASIPNENIRFQKLKKVVYKATSDPNTSLQYISNLFLELETQQINDLSPIKDIIIDRLKEVNRNKTYQLDLHSDSSAQNQKITFLGYEFRLLNKKLEGIYLSENKFSKYTYRIESTLDHYLKDELFNKKNARIMLIHRLNYLTKNVRLLKPKKGLVGIYYSNSLLENNSNCLETLNTILKGLIDTKIPNNTHKELNIILQKFCFKTGFSERKFFNISSQKKSMKATPYKKSAPNRIENSFDKITSIWR